MFWYGSTLVAKRQNTGGEITAVFVAIVTGALQMGQAIPILFSVGLHLPASFAPLCVCVRVRNAWWRRRRVKATSPFF